MSNVRSDADHIEIKFAKRQYIVGQAIKRLPRNAHHHSAARFISQALDLPQQRQPVRLVCKAIRMNRAKQISIRSLEAQQIAVRAR